MRYSLGLAARGGRIQSDRIVPLWESVGERSDKNRTTRTGDKVAMYMSDGAKRAREGGVMLEMDQN